MIVRILGEGQWQVDDGQLDALNTLDDKVEAAVDAGDDESFRTALAQLLLAVRQSGTEVAIDELVESDLILPPADSSIDEVKDLLTDDGLIPG